MDCFCSWQEGRPLSALTPSLCFLSLLRSQVFCSFLLRKLKGTAKETKKKFSLSLFGGLALFFFSLSERGRDCTTKNGQERFSLILFRKWIGQRRKKPPLSSVSMSSLLFSSLLYVFIKACKGNSIRTLSFLSSSKEKRKARHKPKTKEQTIRRRKHYID